MEERIQQKANLVDCHGALVVAFDSLVTAVVDERAAESTRLLMLEGAGEWHRGVPDVASSC